MARTGPKLMHLCCSALILNACEHVGRPDNVVKRRLTWLSYLAGDDLKELCCTHEPPRYRFVYNSIFYEQVRTCEINGFADGGGGMIYTEILSPEVSQDFLVRFPLWSWSGERAIDMSI